MFAGKRYSWDRLLFERGTSAVLDDRGYLADPREGHWSSAQSKCFRVTELLQLNKLGVVVLGEAEIGKSDVMASVRDAVDGQDPRAGVIALNLGTFADAADLDRELFASAQMESWREGSGILYLLLDGLDEALMGINTVVGLFQRRFVHLPYERMRLWISCRTSQWRETLEVHLADQLGCQQALGIYELGPLRRVDVAEAARKHNVDAEVFLEQITSRDAQPLALHPLPLNLLLNVYAQSGGLPKGRDALYEQGLLLLCDEPQDRFDRGHAGKLTKEQRLEIASRIAALTVLTGNSAIYAGKGMIPGSPGVPIAHFVGGEEGASAGHVDVTEEAIRDVLQSGLFRDAGPDAVAFSHKSYAEFLASRYLHRAQLLPIQRDSIFYVLGEGQPKLAPQLHETVAWFASRDSAFFNRILAEEPEVLLLSDVATRDDETKAKVVQGLLARVEAREISYEARRSLRSFFRRLAHSGISEQLSAVIADRSKHNDTRSMAVDLAEECEVLQLASQLADLALEPAEDLRLRVEAGYAVCALKVTEACAKLKPLAVSDAATDPEDQLRGVALRACWPEHMTADEFFQALTRPRRPDFLGSYGSFLLSDGILDQLHSSDLPRAFEWAEEHATQDPDTSSVARLTGQIATRAWEHLQEPGVLARLARFVFKRYQGHESAFYIPSKDGAPLRGNDLKAIDDMITNGTEQRRKMLEAIIDVRRDCTDLHCVVYGKPPLARPEDFEWFLAQACQPDDEKARRWATLAKLVWTWAKASDVDAWLSARERSTIVRQVMNDPLQIEVGSEEYRRLKEEHLRWTVPRVRDRRERPRGPAQSQRVERALQACLGETPTAFWWLVEQLAVGDSATCFTPPTNVRGTPGWIQADELMKRRIVQVAIRYLHTRPNNPLEFLQRGGEFPATDFSAPQALLLLLHEDRVAVETLSREIWRTWTPNLVVQFVEFFGGAANEEKQIICSSIIANAPEEARLAVVTLVRQQALTSSIPRIISLWEEYLDEELAARLMALLGTEPFSDVGFAAVLGWLVRHNVAAARALMTSILIEPLQSGAEGQGRSVAVAKQALIDGTEGIWSLVWARLKQEAQWGREVVQAVCMQEGFGFAKRLSDEACGDLLQWLLEHYPPANDPDHPGVYTPGPEDRVRELRSRLVNYFPTRRTRAAWEAICRVRDAFPQYPWLKDVALETRRSWLQEAWSPPPPCVILELSRNRRSRYLRSGVDLLQTIAESLERYAEKLQGKTPLVSNLWNQIGHGEAMVWRPKDEEHLSDNIAQHLRDDLEHSGVVVNREVKIRPGFCSEKAGGKPGQRTDLLVDAISLTGQDGNPESLTVIIEVKASWHPEVRDALKTQLVERYLRDNRFQYGIYVVGWFAAPSWDRGDARRKRAPWKQITEAVEDLETQAEQLGGCQATRLVKACVLDCSLH